MSNSATPWTVLCQASLSFTISWNLLKLKSVESVMPSNSSHPLSPLPSSARSLSQHQDLFQWVISSLQVARVLELQLLPQSFQWIFSVDFFRTDNLISLLSKGFSRVFSSTTVRKHQFLGIQPSLWFNSHICTWLLKIVCFDSMDLCWQSDVSALAV